jgi:putative tryptophan/tyrosine transport system substrate-binding protein
MAIEHRFPDERPERFESMANELVALNVDVLIAVTLPAARAAQKATRTIPIVFVVVPDPIEAKLVDSPGRPGHNITGLTHITSELAAKRLEFLKLGLPGVERVALLMDGNYPAAARRLVDEHQAVAKPLGLSIHPVEVKSINDFKNVFDKIAGAGLQAISMQAGGLFFQSREAIARLGVERRLPLVVLSRELLLAGALMSYGASQPAIFRRAASFVDRIIKGESPADIPVEQPTRFELIVNLKTAKALGVTIAPTLLVRADELIE